MDEVQEYEFRMPIGDWSGDGHSICDYYSAYSNQPVEQVREVHFKAKEVTGVDIEEICNEYDEPIISSDTVAALEKLGFDFNTYSAAVCDGDDSQVYADSWVMVNLWVFLLMKTDSTLKITVQKDSTPMLPFYSYDAKMRHIGYVGYGVLGT
jgi:hypothetical protein